jgi:tRNA threonylcarbamoyladenosine biosynthesis protein TsaB
MILAMDTATRMISVALHDGTALMAEYSWWSANHHTTELAPALSRLFDETGIRTADLSAIAVPLGPGSYTGLRIGMSLGKGLALSVTPSLPMIGIPTLDIVAAAQPLFGDRLYAISQAGRRRINVGLYRPLEGRWSAQEDPFISAWEDLKIVEPALIAGEIDTGGRQILEKAGDGIRVSPAALGLRRAGVLAEIAWEKLRAGESQALDELAPVYLH